MTASTTLRYGPRDRSLAALIEFQQQIARFLETARRKSAENIFYRRMIAVYEHDLIATSQAIVKRKRQQRRQTAAA